MDHNKLIFTVQLILFSVLALLGWAMWEVAGAVVFHGVSFVGALGLMMLCALAFVTVFIMRLFVDLVTGEKRHDG